MPDVRLEHVEFLEQPGADEGVTGVEIDLDVRALGRRDHRRQGFGGRRRGVTHVDIVLDHDGDTDWRRQAGPARDRLDGAPVAFPQQIFAVETLCGERHPLSSEIVEFGDRARMDAEHGGADPATDVQHPLHGIVVERPQLSLPGRGVDR